MWPLGQRVLTIHPSNRHSRAFEKVVSPLVLQNITCLRCCAMETLCRCCSGACVRKGKSGNVQLYRCRRCAKYQRTSYRNRACEPGVNERIVTYVKEGCGIRSVARILRISPTTVIIRIKRIAGRMRRPQALALGRSYELDELATYCRRKADRVWVAYALERTSRAVVNVAVGARTKKNLSRVVSPLLLARPRSLTTDRLDIYRLLIPPALHRVKVFGINMIERHNLTLRTRLKRLGRRTICFTRSLAMLEACVMIALWG